MQLSTPIAAQQDGNVVESEIATGPRLSYNVSGVNLGTRTTDAKSYHAYDRGQFSPGATIEVWGTLHNRTSAKGDVLLRVYVKYWSREKPQGEFAADTNILRCGPGPHDYRVAAAIPNDAHQVEIMVSSTAAWSSSVTAGFGSKLKPLSER